MRSASRSTGGWPRSTSPIRSSVSAAIANLGMGIPYFIARVMDLGQGIVTAASYEYGNTFLIVAGLLNMLVAIDAYDVRLGREIIR